MPVTQNEFTHSSESENRGRLEGVKNGNILGTVLFTDLQLDITTNHLVQEQKAKS